MSTAIALQNVDPTSTKDSTTVRQRNVLKPDSLQEDPWLDQPHDLNSSTLPLDSHAFTPTSIYWITPHGMLTKAITVLDLTSDIPLPHAGLTDTYKSSIKTTLKDHSFTPILTCHRQTFLGLEYTIADAHCTTIATWTHPWLSSGAAILSFPTPSPYSDHPITLKNKTWGLRTETFTLNSRLYVWEYDSMWHSYRMTLYRVSGLGDTQKKIVVGRYSEKWWGSCKTGGCVGGGYGGGG